MERSERERDERERDERERGQGLNCGISAGMFMHDDDERERLREDRRSLVRSVDEWRYGVERTREGKEGFLLTEIFS